MLSILSLLFALRHGPGPALVAPVRMEISARAEAHAVAAESLLRPAALLEAERDLAAAPHAPQWPASPSTPGVAPVFQAHRPEEWISIVSGQLHLEHNTLTKAAVQAAAWVVTMPVRVDVSPQRVYVTVRVAAF